MPHKRLKITPYIDVNNINQSVNQSNTQSSSIVVAGYHKRDIYAFEFCVIA
jgi:hypothetical protein